MIAISIARYNLSLLEAKRLTLSDFFIYKKAWEIRRQERREDMSYQAWRNREIKADKKVGKNYRPAFESFKDFYDSEKEFNQIFNPPQENKKENISDFERMNRAIQLQKGGN